ncbi:MAG: ATPase, T2SS/T4P/T4SS family [Micropruina sp.]|uniref:CpaF family protein n=1 Tax=Micropruina sp. TaxID=2737536 RepID=UPI0039E6EB1F
MTKLTAVPLLRDLPFETTVSADRLPGRRPRNAEAPDWADTQPCSEATADEVAVDWSLVVVLRRKASELITRALAEHAEANGVAMPEVDRRLLGRSIVRQVVRDHVEELSSNGQALWSIALERAYADSVESAIFGYGRLQPLFEIPAAENIEIHGHDSVMVQFGDGRREQRPPVADSDQELVEAIRFLGESVTPARPFDDAHPTMTLALGDRFRLHAIGFGLSYRPSITIRQHILTDVSLKDLVGTGMLPDQVGRFLHAAVMARKSVVIAGDQGAGKTTLLRALIEAIPDNERFGTLETDYELLTHLRPNRRNMLALQAKVGLGEHQDGRRLGEYTVADLIPEALRQNLSRLVVGEVRGTEAGAMFEAMQSGAGTLSTTHSHSASSTMDRLASRVAQGGVLSVDEAYRQIAHHIHLLVYVKLVDDTWRGGRRTRLVAEIRQLTGAIEAGRPVTHLVYSAATATQPEVFHPEPAFADELAEFHHAWDQP